MSTLLPVPENTRSALAIVDMQEFFFQKPERRQNLETTIQNINRLISFFEVHHLPVVHVITSYKTDGSDWELKMKITEKPELIENTPETAIVSQIKVSPDHLLVKKTRYSAFFKTNLADFLRDNHIHRLMVVGAYTHYCVNATVFDAYAYDFVPGIITDAVVSHLPEEAALMLDRMRRNGYHVCRTKEFLEGA
jgi:nicotinamidase-related amidase